MTQRQIYISLTLVVVGLLTIATVYPYLTVNRIMSVVPVEDQANTNVNYNFVQTVNSSLWTTANLSKFYLSKLNAIEFLGNYRNPCWFRLVGGYPRLQCLPYFYIIGAKKGGTTELYDYVMRHPEVVGPGFKESHWFSERRYGWPKPGPKQPKLASRTDFCSVTYYSDMFELATQRVKATVAKRQSDVDYHPLVFADATPAYLHVNWFWESFPGNEGLAEPRIVLLDYIRKVTPDAKILVILRDPVDRMLSDYVHSMSREGVPLSLEDFHARMVRNVNAYTECFKTATVRSCVYNNTLHNSLDNGGMNFRLGIYPVYVRELQRVFRRDQLMVISLADFISAPRDTMAAVFRFLELRLLSSKEMDRVCDNHKVNKGRYTALGETRTMMEKTRQMLQRFYDPFNRELASLLNDTRYLFSSSVD